MPIIQDYDQELDEREAALAVIWSGSHGSEPFIGGVAAVPERRAGNADKFFRCGMDALDLEEGVVRGR